MGPWGRVSVNEMLCFFVQQDFLKNCFPSSCLIFSYLSRDFPEDTVEVILLQMAADLLGEFQPGKLPYFEQLWQKFKFKFGDVERMKGKPLDGDT